MASVNLQEKANFTRLSRLLVDKGTEALRNTLDAIHPANLPAVLNASRTTLLRLKPRVINDTQWDLLFPPSGNPPDSKTFDVTLLTVLLRNLAGLPPPVTGWNTMPPDTDNSLQANITRIKLFRNHVYGHVASTQVDKITFDHLWQKISKALVDLKIPQKEIDDLKTCPLGPEEEIYGQSLKEWVLKEEECKDMLDDLTRNVNLMHNQLKQSVLQQKDDREAMQHLRQIIEQSHQGIQQLYTSSSSESELPRPTYASEESKASEKHSMEEQLLQKLAKHNFKSKIRSKVKFFHPGTREWLLEQIYNWFADEDESRLLLLTAGPGFGKSVFAAKVCKIFEEKRRLAACHFCDFSDSNLKDPMMMLQSLASHMCQNIVGFKEKLLDQLKRPHKVDSLKDAFQIYLQNPLDELEVEHSLIVIDGLDESATDDKSDMVKLIADNFPDLPRCVKVLVTSRPELSLQRLDHIEVIEIDVDDMDNESDILKYLNVCLPTLAARDEMNHSTQAHHFNVLPAIVEKCEGSFLYAFHVQHELGKRQDLHTITFEDIMSFLPKGMGSIYEAYFRRLEIELEAVMKRNPDLFKLLELLVAIDAIEEEAGLPLTFIARALNLALDCRETRKIIKKVNEAISCLLYVSDDLITVFHKSVCDWLLANGYDDHEYTVEVSDGKKRLWLVCEQVFKEIKRSVCLEHNLKLTKDVTHALQHGHDYLFACQIKDSFSWFVDMIIVHVLSNVLPKSIRNLENILEKVLRSDVALSVRLRQRISWHLTEISYVGNHEILMPIIVSWDKFAKLYSYLEAVLDYSPEGCFTDDERKIAEVILAKKSSLCVKRNSTGMKPLKPLVTTFYYRIVAVGVSSSKKLAAVALNNGTICILSLPELIKLWQYPTEYNRISCCTFAPDDTFVLYGKLETVLNIGEKKEAAFFGGEVERFKSCAFSPNGKRLITNDGSDTIMLWDVVRRSLVSVLSAGAPVDGCTFSNTGLFILGGKQFTRDDAYCVWNSITLQRVDQRSCFSGNKRGKKDGVLRSERCNRCFRQECKELIPSKALGIMTPMMLNRHWLHVMSSLLNRMEKRSSNLSTGVYKEVDCFFYLANQESLRVIENIHFTTLGAWEIFIGSPRIPLENVHTTLDITAIENDHWLYADNRKLVVFSSKENPSIRSHPACVFWCSFSPDSTRLATCTSDGFINMWNVDTSQVYQRFRNNLETSPSACWWSDKYLFVCHVIDTIPSLSRYPVDRTLKIVTTEKQPVPLCSVNNEFLSFSGFLDFSEGYLSFECGGTKPVKVIDIKKLGHPKVVILPGIRPMMSIAVSSRASFVLGAGKGYYFLWKKNETQPSAYNVFVWFDSLSPGMERLGYIIGMPSSYECCFSNDSKFALVCYNERFNNQRIFVVIDVDTGIMAVEEIEDSEAPDSSIAIPKVFCTNTVVIHLIPNMIEIYDLESWKRLESSFQRHLTKTFVIHSKLSPTGTVLAVPRLTGDMEFLHLRIPKYSSVPNGQKNWERLGGVKFISPGPVRFGIKPEVKKKVKETLPGPDRFGNIPKVEKKVNESLPGPGRFENIPKVERKVKESLTGPGRSKNIRKVDKKVKETLPGSSRFENMPKVEKKVKETLPGPGRFGNIQKVEKKFEESLPGHGGFENTSKVGKKVNETLPGPGRFGNIPKVKKKVKKTFGC
jgi:WD40 repeat protein